MPCTVTPAHPRAEHPCPVCAAAELGMTLSMFFNFENTVNDIWKSNKAKGQE